MTDVDAFLAQSSGEKHPAFKFENIGDTCSGTLVEPPKVVERPSLKDGSPEKQLVINLDTKDGVFTLWVRRGFMASAIADAINAAGASGLEVGGKLHVKFTEKRDTGKPRPAYVYKAKYEPPAAATVNPDDIFG